VLNDSSGFQLSTRKTFETTEAAGRVVYLFLSAFGNLMKPEARGREISCPTKKNSLNYHLNNLFF